VCANARASVLGPLGGARGLEEDGVAREQELARRRESWRLGRRRCDVERAGVASARPGRRWARRGRTCGLVQSGAGAGYMASRAAATRGQRSRGGRERGRRKRTGL
jgi:hypothetical protein